MAVEEISIHVILPVIVGFIIGIIEAYFVYEDENMTSGQQFIGDMWHGMLFSIFGVLAASNVPWLLSHGFIPDFLLGMLMVEPSGNSLVISVIITLFMMVKMVGSHAIRGVSGNGFSEKMWHKLVIAVAIGFAPYYMVHIYAAGWFTGMAAAVPWLPF